MSSNIIAIIALHIITTNSIIRQIPYTGKAVTPSANMVVVKLDGTEISKEKYDISYYNNIDKGNNAILILQGKGDMHGIKAVKFKIRAADAVKDNDLWQGVINLFRAGHS